MGGYERVGEGLVHITNKFSLPEALVNACHGFDKSYRHGRGDTKISVTQLINPPLIRRLIEEHFEDLEEDVSDRIWSILGSAVHAVLQHSATDEDLSEERLSTMVNGWKVSGQADLLDKDGTLTDYKITSVWNVIKEAKTEWEVQLNLLAYLFEKAGFPVRKLQIIAILRDWSKGKAKEGNGYPEVGAKAIEISRWTTDACEKYLADRVGLHQAADALDISQIPQCSPEERWKKEDSWALMKEGNKRASKIYDNAEDATRACVDKNMYVEHRPGLDVRCEDYCVVRKFCPYKKEAQ